MRSAVSISLLAVATVLAHSAAPAPALAQEIHDQMHCLEGCPAGAPANNDIVVREIYILSNDGTTKFATWVAYEITRDTIGPTKPRGWKRDPLLPKSETLESPDSARHIIVLGHIERRRCGSRLDG